MTPDEVKLLRHELVLLRHNHENEHERLRERMRKMEKILYAILGVLSVTLGAKLW